MTICLPLFLAGGEGDRAFAKFHPTITIDGCDLKCAAHGTETYSAKPAASIVVSELAAEHGITGIEGRRCLNQAGKQAVELTAERLSVLVDKVLGKEKRPTGGATDGHPTAPGSPDPVVCSCGSGIPVKMLRIAGTSREVVALPIIFERIREKHPSPGDDATKDLMEMVKVYNYVPPDEEVSWRETLVKEYEVYCERETSK